MIIIIIIIYKGKYYTLGAIGTNGYIVSMYPIKRDENCVNFVRKNSLQR